MTYQSGNQLIDARLLFDKAQMQFGMHIADFGCGRTGHVVFPASLAVGTQGIVYAVDVMRDVLESISKRAQMESLVNIHTIWSNLEYVGKTAIPASSLDVVFIVNVLSQADNRHGILEEASRLLKLKGRIVVVDWTRKGLSFSPDDDRFVDFDNIKQWGRTNGFGVQEEFAVGPYHHGIVLYRSV